METKTLNFLNFFFLILFSILVRAETELTLPKKINVLILEKSSRIELLSQKINVDSGGTKSNSAQTFPLNAGQLLNKYKVRYFAKMTTINSKPGTIWLEATLLDPSGKTVAYATLTATNDKFSVGTGFDDPSDTKHKLVFMVDTTNLEK